MAGNRVSWFDYNLREPPFREFAPGGGSDAAAAGLPGPGAPAAPGRARFDVPPEADELAAAVRRAREEAARHDADAHRLRAPRPEKMQR